MDKVVLAPRPEAPARLPGLFRLLTLLRGDLLAALPRGAYRGQVMSVRAFRRRIVVVNHPEVVRDVFVVRGANYNRKSHFKEQALRPVIGESLFANHGEVWARRRKPVAQLLHPSGIAALQPVFHAVGLNLAARWAAAGGTGGVIDVAPDLAAATLDIMLRAVLGEEAPPSEAAAIADAFGRFQSTVQVIDLPHLLGLPGWAAGRQRRAALGAAAEIRRRIAALVDRRPAAAGYLGGMRAALAGDGAPVLDAEALREEVCMMLLAGSETTANALCWTLYLLATHPAWAARVRAEGAAVLSGRLPDAADLAALAVTRAVLQEAMRLYPPVAVLARQPAAPDRIRRWAVHPGDTVLCIPWLLHRHEDIWDAPHAFHPERFLPGAKPVPRFAYLPFGLGARVCAGGAFGLAEMTTLLAMLVQRLDIAPAPGVVPVPRFRLTLRPDGGMPLRVRPAGA